ncbi:MAG TPA: hypothetical protein VGP80_13650 [Gemmatimonadales bacterium]|jgi:hypothetical protein|nr:hypothetical protein [Gemmatimonadales bacterium]
MRHLVVAFALTFATGAEAQVLDQGTLVIKQGGREIGREEFVVRSGRTGGATGTTMVTRGRFPAVAPALSQEATVERKGDGSFANIQITREQGAQVGRFIAEVTPRNVLRIHASSSGGSEEVREYPGVPRLVGLADSAFALYSAVVPLATPGGETITAVYPDNGRRVTFSARRVDGDDGSESRIVMSGDINGTIWLDASSHILRLEFPSVGLEAVRLRH